MTTQLTLAETIDLTPFIKQLPRHYTVNDDQTRLPCLFPRVKASEVDLNPFSFQADLRAQVIISCRDKKIRRNLVVLKRRNEGGLHPGLLNHWIRRYFDSRFASRPDDLFFKPFYKTDPWEIRYDAFEIMLTGLSDHESTFSVVIDKNGTRMMDKKQKQIDDDQCAKEIYREDV